MEYDFAVWFQGKDLKDLAISMANVRGVNGVAILLNAPQTPFTKQQMKTALPLVYKSERMLSKGVKSTVLNQNAKIAKDAIDGANDDAELVDLIERKAKKAPKQVGVKVVDGKSSKKRRNPSAVSEAPEDDSEDDDGPSKKQKNERAAAQASEDGGDREEEGQNAKGSPPANVKGGKKKRFEVVESDDESYSDGDS
jgi:hypothetical protein